MITRDQWTQALRSGKYSQARGSLKVLGDGGEVEGFCCLGVACHAAKLPETDVRYGWRGSVQGGLLPLEIATALKLSATSQWYLSRLNDSGKLTFSQIADIIDTMEEDDMSDPDFFQIIKRDY